MSEMLPRFASEPEQVIVEAVQAVEPQLAATLVERVLITTVKRRPDRRDLAQALDADPELLTSTRAAGPAALGRLIHGLREHGAVRLQLPRCARCGAQRQLKGQPGQPRICASCQTRLIARANPCVICGSRNYSGRDRDGQPRCTRHPPHDGRDVLAELVQLIAEIPIALPKETIAEAVRSTERSKNGQLRLLWALEDVPGLLTGDGTHGPPRGLRLIHELLARGAQGVVNPPCPYCRRNIGLTMQRDGLRCCRNCWQEIRPQTCSRCKKNAQVATRTHDGKALCGNCYRSAPFNQRICVQCGELKRALGRTSDGLVCRRCHQLPFARCSVCDSTRPCHSSRTGSPVCGPCRIEAHPPKECSGCGLLRWVEYLTASGEPLCKQCRAPKGLCAQCERTRPTYGRTAQGEPLCETCWKRHERARRPCSGCGTVERLFHFGMCASCAARHQLTLALTGPDGAMRKELVYVHSALLRITSPRALLAWLRRSPGSRDVLNHLVHGSGPVTHEVLDDCRPVKVARHLRAVLVAGGALPERDEHLAVLELWLADAYVRVPAAEDRQTLRSYITCQHLRRLRQAGRPITHGQAQGVRHEAATVVRLLQWLDRQGHTLTSCAQDHIDTWMADGPVNRSRARSFLNWAARRGSAPPLEFPTETRDFSVEVIAQDHRWQLVRRLVHDETLDDVVRVAGLLVLLFAQPPSRITQLTTDHVTCAEDSVSIRLGKVPAQVPPPLDELIRRLVRRRRGHSATEPDENLAWLFPGGYAGRPMSSAHLSHRLKQIGIRPRAGRHTALMDIAAELPAVVVSRLLGFHQNTADLWQRERQGFSPEHAADLSRR
ncbi:hypothetical protein [Streptomyces sp. NPDC055243]|uniref:hypothetical protein n=1 Tax=Streptomyces sp. NPDC055243 TaxID=3365720 RepID=UPI0037D10521